MYRTHISFWLGFIKTNRRRVGRGGGGGEGAGGLCICSIRNGHGLRQEQEQYLLEMVMVLGKSRNNTFRKSTKDFFESEKWQKGQYNLISGKLLHISVCGFFFI